jgi:hypothetical protein
MATRNTTRDANPDPITGAPGSHPVGTGLGAAAGGLAAGATAGSVAGPIGTVVGAAAGAVVGGLAGKAAEEAIDPTTEDAYWRENYRNRPYVEKGTSYDTYQPAYQYGWEARRQHRGKRFDEVESSLAAGWQKTKAHASMGWEKAKDAARDAWDRIERAIPGDADHDGK